MAFIQTNSIFSLWLTKEFFDKDFIIINSDVICEPAVINDMINNDSDICVGLTTKWSDERGYKAHVKNGSVVNMSMDIAKNPILR